MAELKGEFQVIVTDHAEVNELWFAEAVVERWRGGQALVPRSWTGIAAVGTDDTAPSSSGDLDE